MHQPQGALDQDPDHDLPETPSLQGLKKTRKSYPFYNLVSPCPTRSGSPAYANFTLLVSGLPSPSALVFLRGAAQGILGWGAMLHCAAVSPGSLPCL